MDKNKFYKARFSYVPPEERGYLKARTCEVVISVGQPYHEGNKFRATLREVNKQFKKCTIIVSDTLQRYTLAIQDGLTKTPDDFYELSLNLGTEWIERNQHIIDEELKIPHQIVRWELFSKNSLFKDDHKKVKELYNTNSDYKAVIDDVAKDFLKRNSKIDTEYAKNFAYSVEYLLEECAIVLQWKEFGCDYEVYPTVSKVFFATFKFLNVPKEKKEIQIGIKFDEITEKSFNKKIDFNSLAFDKIMQSASGHIYWKDVNGVFLGANLQQAKSLQYENIESLLGKTEFDLFDFEKAKKIRDNDLKVINEKKSLTFEEDGQYEEKIRTFLSYKNPLMDENGNVVGILGISLDISKQKHYEQELIKKNELLDKALKVKNEFINNMSHEIKTPLSSILKISDHLYETWDNYPDNDARKEHLKIAIDSNERLRSVLANILDFSQARSGKMQYNKELHSLVKSVSDVIGEFIDEKHRIKLKDKSKGQKSFFDNCRIEQVIRNLIANAIKYGGEDQILIELACINGNLSFSITDKGVGIPENEKKAIFEIFTQSSRTKTMAGGTGIGLSICKQIISDHDGDIIAKNNANGIGSNFSFFIPIEAGKAENKTEKISETKIKKRPIALIVDDQDNVLKVTSLILDNMGFEVITADCGMDGFKKLEKNFEKIDFVLLDVMMPDIYGINLLEQIKQDKKLSSVPIYMYSSLSDPKEISKALGLGAEGFIDKALSKDKIQEILQVFL